MRALTRNIGTSHVIERDPSQKVKITRVLVCRPNHRLGNILLMTPLIREIYETFPDAKVDLFVKGNLTPVVFKNYPNVEQIIQLPKKPFSDLGGYLSGWLKIKKNRYDVVVNVDSTSSSGRLSVQFANARYKFFGDTEENLSERFSDAVHIAKYPVYIFRNYSSKLGYAPSDRPVPSLNILLGQKELAEGKTILSEVVQNDKKTIALFTNATGNKIYDQAWWGELYQKLKAAFADYNIIEILPVENTSQIGFKAPTYAHKDVRVVGSVIANTSIFIGADSGMMHLATAVDTPTLGLFKVTNVQLYEPYGNHSLAVDTNETDIDQIIAKTGAILAAV